MLGDSGDVAKAEQQQQQSRPTAKLSSHPKWFACLCVCHHRHHHHHHLDTVLLEHKCSDRCQAEVDENTTHTNQTTHDKPSEKKRKEMKNKSTTAETEKKNNTTQHDKARKASWRQNVHGGGRDRESERQSNVKLALVINHQTF